MVTKNLSVEEYEELGDIVKFGKAIKRLQSNEDFNLLIKSLNDYAKATINSARGQRDEKLIIKLVAMSREADFVGQYCRDAIDEMKQAEKMIKEANNVNDAEREIS